MAEALSKAMQIEMIRRLIGHWETQREGARERMVRCDEKILQLRGQLWEAKNRCDEAAGDEGCGA